MNVLVCGDRHWNDWLAIRRELSKLDPTQTTIITGGATGADSIAEQAARRLEFFCVMVFPAWWDRQFKPAGPIRNRRMLEWGKPDLVLAFHKNLGESKGTADMVMVARKAGVEVRVFTE